MILSEKQIVETIIQRRAGLLAYIASIVHDGHLAEDVLQEVIVLAIEKRDEIRDPDAIAAWFRSTARFCALQVLEQRSKQPRALDAGVLDLLEDEWARQDDQWAEDSSMVALRTCLGELSPSARSVIELRYGQRMRTAEIAKKLDRTVGAVYKTTQRAHAALAECVKLHMRETDG